MVVFIYLMELACFFWKNDLLDYVHGHFGVIAKLFSRIWIRFDMNDDNPSFQKYVLKYFTQIKTYQSKWKCKHFNPHRELRNSIGIPINHWKGDNECHHGTS